jgi:N-glycosylase/DNA lyase
MPGVQSFDPITSVSSGQTFLWQKLGGAWYGIDGQHILKISMDAGKTHFSSFPERKSWERNFFRLDDAWDRIIRGLSSDHFVSLLFEKYQGLRLLRQDPEQCLFSFVCASNTNIPMIRRMLYNICRKFGERLEYDGHEFFAFPSASSLNHASLSELLACGLGYRAKAIRSAARQIADGSIDLEQLSRASYEEAKEQLTQIYGIGNKIADCILLFSLEKLDAFPIDVWIARSLSEHYPWLHDCKIGEKLTSHQYKVVSEKMRNYFGSHAGYAQQYLFYEIRQNAGRRW